MEAKWAKNFILQFIPFVLGAIFFSVLTKNLFLGLAILLLAVTTIGYNSYRLTDQLDEAEMRINELEDDLDEAERRAEELKEEIEDTKALALIL